MEINYGETSVFPAQMMKNDTKFFAIFNWLIHLVHLFCVISLFPMIQILWIRKPKRRVYLWCVLMSFGMQRYGRSLVATLLALSCSERDRHERSPRIYRENQEYPATEEESRLKDTEIHKGNNLLKRTKFSCDCRWNDLHTTTPFTVQHNIPRFDFFLSLDFSCFFSFSFTIHMITQINSARVFFFILPLFLFSNPFFACSSLSPLFCGYGLDNFLKQTQNKNECTKWVYVVDLFVVMCNLTWWSMCFHIITTKHNIDFLMRLHFKICEYSVNTKWATVWCTIFLLPLSVIVCCVMFQIRLDYENRRMIRYSSKLFSYSSYNEHSEIMSRFLNVSGGEFLCFYDKIFDLLMPFYDKISTWNA